MAIRENPTLTNKHTGYLARSGYGKSQALKQNPDLPRRGVRTLLWDPGHDHAAQRFTDQRSYKAAVKSAMASCQGFRLAWCGEQSVPVFEWWCRLAWICLDGQQPLYLVIEELAAVQPSAGAAPPAFGMLVNQSRKYAGVIHWTTQRSAEISKTVLDQTENFYIGRPGRMATRQNIDQLARVAECRPEDLQALQPLQFYRGSSHDVRLVKLKYKKI